MSIGEHTIYKLGGQQNPSPIGPATMSDDNLAACRSQSASHLESDPKASFFSLPFPGVGRMCRMHSAPVTLSRISASGVGKGGRGGGEKEEKGTSTITPNSCILFAASVLSFFFPFHLAHLSRMWQGSRVSKGTKDQFAYPCPLFRDSQTPPENVRAGFQTPPR